MEIDSVVDVRHSTRIAICRACRLASSSSLANDAVPATTESGSAVLGGVASLLHDAFVSSAHFSLFVFPSALLVSVWRPKLAESSNQIGPVFADSCRFLGLLYNRLF